MHSRSSSTSSQSLFELMEETHNTVIPPLLGEFIRAGAEEAAREKREAEAGASLPVMPPNFLSRDLMLQLTCSLNSGLHNFSTAYELIRQGAEEINNVKAALEKLYRNQHMSVDAEELFASTGPKERWFPETDVDNEVEKKVEPIFFAEGSEPTAEAEDLQVSVDPFQFLTDLVQNQPQPVVVKPVVIRGRKGRGRKPNNNDVVPLTTTAAKESKPVTRRPRQRKNKIESSSYNSTLANSTREDFLNHLQTVEATHKNDDRNHRLVFVPTVDLRDALSRVPSLKPNVARYQVDQILAELENAKRITSQSSSDVADKTLTSKFAAAVTNSGIQATNVTSITDAKHNLTLTSDLGSESETAASDPESDTRKSTSTLALDGSVTSEFEEKNNLIATQSEAAGT